jgi:LacI family transcriptional regulator
MRIAILLNTGGYSGRGILRGVGAYAQTADQWACQFQAIDDGAMDRLRRWKPDGVIAEVYLPTWIPKLKRLGVPVVDVARSLSDARRQFPLVTQHDLSIGTMAADHFVQQGYRRLAYVGVSHETYSLLREESFVQRAREAAIEVMAHRVVIDSKNRVESDWRRQDDRLREFIRTKLIGDEPVGLFCSNDGRAIQFLEVARQMKLDVPGHVAVLGCDNDDLLCSLSRPALSSVAIPFDRIGYQAAAMLDRMLKGKPVSQIERVNPTSIITRQSSDATAVRDPDLAAAMRFIRDNAHRPIRGDEVVEQAAVARRAIERRFKQQLGRTLRQEIERAHVTLARQMLAHTDLPMPVIANKCGLGSLRNLSLVFRKVVGQTPSAYRRDHRMR